MKDPLVRFSVAIGGELLRRFDQYRELHRYPNRSEAVRGLMRGGLDRRDDRRRRQRGDGGRHPDLRPSRLADRAPADRLAAPSSRPGRHHDSRPSRREALPGSDLAPRPRSGDPQPGRRLDRHQGGRDRPARPGLGRGRRRAKRRRAIASSPSARSCPSLGLASQASCAQLPAPDQACARGEFVTIARCP